MCDLCPPGLDPKAGPFPSLPFPSSCLKKLEEEEEEEEEEKRPAADL